MKVVEWQWIDEKENHVGQMKATNFGEDVR
jgi:hypothetical protein